MTFNLGELIPMATLPNFRDIGGWPTHGGGRVRRGLLYRSVALHHVGDADLAACSKLGIRSVYDLRTDGERTAEPDRILNGVELIVVDVLADSTEAAPAQRLGPLSNPNSGRRDA